MPFYCYSPRRWEGALLAQYENSATGRCLSFSTMMPVPESPRAPQPTGRGSDTRSLVDRDPQW